jgi:hypothetical protein
MDLVGYPDEVQEQSYVHQFLADHPDAVLEQTSYVRQFVAGHPDAVQEHTPFARQLTGHPDAVQEQTPYVHHVLHFRRDSWLKETKRSNDHTKLLASFILVQGFVTEYVNFFISLIS